MIRKIRAQDEASLARLYEAAFPTEDLVPLLRRLHAEVPDLLSLVAVSGANASGAENSSEECVGHALFTPCAVEGTDRQVALLGPIAVAPFRQRQGLGATLIREGSARLCQSGIQQVLVLGDPAYYGRLGFRPEKRIRPPYELPADWAGAWQSALLEGNAAPLSGTLRPPGAWLAPSLWAP